MDEQLGLANGRTAIAVERLAIAIERTALGERRASMCEERLSAFAFDAHCVVAYSNEATRCLLLVRDAEWRVEFDRQVLASMQARRVELE